MTAPEAAGTERPPFPFIVGCARSGTTLLRVMLASGGQIAIPGESFFIPKAAADAAGGFDVERFLTGLDATRHGYVRWDVDHDAIRARVRATPVPDLAEAIRRVFETYAASRGLTRYADKTPHYTSYVPLLAALFPEARFVHLVRDGRDVASAYVDATFGPTTLSSAAWVWRTQVTRAPEAGAVLGPERYLEVRYEELVADPEPTLRRVCSHIELPFDPAMVRPGTGSRRCSEGRPVRTTRRCGVRSPSGCGTGAPTWRRSSSPSSKA